MFVRWERQESAGDSPSPSGGISLYQVLFPDWSQACAEWYSADIRSQGSQAFANRFTLLVHYRFKPLSAVQFEAFGKPCSLV
jgi:hypothetical protein